MSAGGINNVRIELSNDAASSVANMYSTGALGPVGHSNVGSSSVFGNVSNFASVSMVDKKLCISISSVRLEDGALTLVAERVAPKRALKARDAAVLSVTNKAEIFGSIASIGEGIFKLISGDKAMAAPLIGVGLMGIFNFVKEKITDLVKG
jgi:hypothetical protein